MNARLDYVHVAPPSRALASDSLQGAPPWRVLASNSRLVFTFLVICTVNVLNGIGVETKRAAIIILIIKSKL